MLDLYLINIYIMVVRNKSIDTEIRKLFVSLIIQGLAKSSTILLLIIIYKISNLKLFLMIN